MKNNTFGRILESEYIALETINSHVTAHGFMQLKRKYRGQGSQPDYLNKQELDRFGVSKDSYARSIKKLLEIGLLKVADIKILNGFKCRLFSFPHENGVIKETQQSDSRTVDSNSHIIVPNGTIVGPLHAQQYDGASRRYDSRTPLRSEDKKIKKEDQEDGCVNLNPNISSLKISSLETIKEGTSDLLVTIKDPTNTEIETLKDQVLEPTSTRLDTIKETTDKISITTSSLERLPTIRRIPIWPIPRQTHGHRLRRNYSWTLWTWSID